MNDFESDPNAFVEEQKVVIPLQYGQIIQQVEQTKKDKRIRERQAIYEAIVEDINKDKMDALYEISQNIPLLLKEPNANILSQLLSLVVQSVKNNLVPSVLAVATAICETCLNQVKPSIKEQTIVVLGICGGKYPSVLDLLMDQKYINHTNTKVSIQASLALVAAIGQTLEVVDSKQLLLSLAAYTNHKDKTVRENVIKCILLLAQNIPSKVILKTLEDAKVQKFVIQAVDEQLAQLQQNVAENQQIIGQQIEEVNLSKFQQDAFDTVQGAKIVVNPRFYELLNCKKWKDKYETLEELYKQFESVPKANIASFDLPAVVNICKQLIIEEITVIIVGSALRLLGMVALKCGTLGQFAAVKQLLAHCMNRVKERKFAVTNGFQVFSNCILVRSYTISNIFAEYLNVAIPHKNPEVKEDFCKLLKVIYATSIVYCNIGQLQDANLKIAEIANEFFPQPQFLKTEEEIPVEGEKSYGMQLNGIGNRQRVCVAAQFQILYDQLGNIQEQVIFQAEQCQSFLNFIEKLLNDVQNNTRQLAKKMVCMCAISHLMEAFDCVQRSESRPDIVKHYDAVFAFFYNYIHQHKRKGEFLEFMEQVIKWVNIQHLGSFLAAGNFAGQQTVQDYGEQQENVRNMRQVFANKVVQVQQQQVEQNQIPQQVVIQQPQPQTQVQQAQQPIQVTNKIQREKVQQDCYQVRSQGQQTKFIVDPYIQSNSVPRVDLEVFYNKLSTVFGEDTSILFIKGISSANILATGILKTTTEMLKQIISNLSPDNKQLFDARDLLLRYANLLLCDGFIAKQAPSPAVIKLALEMIENIIQMCKSANVSFSSYDIECGLFVLLGRLEQFGNAATKQAVQTTVDNFVNNCSSLQDVVVYIMNNFAGKSYRYTIRQMPTKLAIMRLVAGLINTILINQQQLNTNLGLFSNAVNFYQQADTQVCNFVDSYFITSNLRLTNGKQIGMFILNMLYNLSSQEQRDKYLQLCIRTLTQQELSQITSTALINASLQGQASIQEQYVVQDMSNQPQMQDQLVQQQLQQQQQKNLFQQQQSQQQVVHVSEIPVQIPQSQPFNTTGQFTFQKSNLQQQQNTEQLQINENYVHPQPILKQAKTPKGNQRVTFQEDAPVENINDMNLPDLIVPAELFQSQNKPQLTPIDQSTFGRFDVQTPQLNMNNSFSMMKSQNQQAAGQLVNILNQFFESVILDPNRIIFALNVVKQLCVLLRQTEGFDILAVNTQIGKIVFQTSKILRAHINSNAIEQPLSLHQCKLYKYYIVLADCLLNCSLIDQEVYYKVLLQDAIAFGGLFQTKANKQQGFAFCAENLELLNGFLNRVFQVAEPCRLLCAVLQLCSQTSFAKLNNLQLGPSSSDFYTTISQNHRLEVFGFLAQYALRVADVCIQMVLERLQEYLAAAPDLSRSHAAQAFQPQSQLELLFFQIHLFYLRQAGPIIAGISGDEIQFIDYYLQQMVNAAGDRVFGFLNKVPDVPGNLLRKTLTEKFQK